MVKIALPLKRQWEAMLANPADYMPQLQGDVAFAGTYGPSLAKKRAEFLEMAHPAWEVVGKWLHDMVNKDSGWLHTLKALTESGVFFTWDPMTKTVIPTLRTARDWVEPCNDGYGHFIDEEPSIIWLLSVRPHVSVLQEMLIRHFHNRGQQALSKHEGRALVSIVTYMTADELGAYSSALLLMLEWLDYRGEPDLWFIWESGSGPGRRNVAFDVWLAMGRGPEGCVRCVLTYLFDNGDELPHSGRQRQAFTVLSECVRREDLEEAIAGVSDDDLFRIVDADIDDLFHDDALLSFIELLCKAKRRFSEPTLLQFADAIFDDYKGRLGEYFRDLCRVSVGSGERLPQIMEEAGF